MADKIDYKALMVQVYETIQKKPRTRRQLMKQFDLTENQWNYLRQKDSKGGRHLESRLVQGPTYDYYTFHYNKKGTPPPPPPDPVGPPQDTWRSPVLDRAWDKF